MQGILDKLKNMVLDFNIDNAEQTAKEAIESGVDPIEAANALTEGIQIVGDKFGTGELFLPDLVCASEVLKKAFPIINTEIEKRGEKAKSLGKVVLGTVFGDIHNIGKDMVSTLLYAAGFEVIDLGINVKSEDFLKAVREESPDILAMSALLTTTSAEQKNVIEGLIKAGLRDKVKIIVGGSPINQEFADLIGADGYGATAPEGVKMVKRFLGLK
ncbi:MAG: cobalamin-dependent protein [Actinobacteria bacterium]|jgi:trimethylamine corrinoid protein|nr:cobalamin B12-binding domain-containing protein [Actinomycetota bacterium]MCJ7473157.1 cobalamin-dependent protein [Actinomycetota bacterium]